MENTAKEMREGTPLTAPRGAVELMAWMLLPETVSRGAEGFFAFGLGDRPFFGPLKSWRTIFHNSKKIKFTNLRGGRAVLSESSAPTLLVMWLAKCGAVQAAAINL